MRLTIKIREAIVESATKAKFKDQIEAMKEQRKLIGDAIYAERFPENPEYSREWVRHYGSISVFHELETSPFYIRGRTGVELEIKKLFISNFPMSKERPKPLALQYKAHDIDSEELATMKVKSQVDAFYDQAAKLENEFKELRSDLCDLLNSVNTFKQLQAAWPEGSAIYDQHKPKPKTAALVDAGLALKLTQALTPPLEVAK